MCAYNKDTVFFACPVFGSICLVQLIYLIIHSKKVVTLAEFSNFCELIPTVLPALIANDATQPIVHFLFNFGKNIKKVFCCLLIKSKRSGKIHHGGKIQL